MRGFHPQTRSLRAAAGVALWLAATGGGIAVLSAYSGAPGRQEAPPTAWPAASSLELDPAHPTLVLFLHPQCPCSSATLEQLARLLTVSADKPATHLCFVRPAGLDEELVHGSLWRQAERLPEVRLHVDEDGREARLFGAATSGAAVLFDTAGRPLYSGGITVARGHSGDNPGRSALTAILSGREPAVATAPVFGCDLASDDTASAAEACHE